MAKRLTKEELKAKYGKSFSGIRDLSFGVEFPDGQKSVLRLMAPSQYKTFVRTFEGVMKQLMSIGLPKFQPLDEKGKSEGEPFKGSDVTPAAKPIWELGEDGKPKIGKDKLKVPKLDEEGMPLMREFPNIRIELDGGDIKEIPRKRIRKILPSEKDLIEALESIVWGNARKMLVILFPEDEGRFSPEYIDAHLNVPFMRTLLDLVIDMNGLDFLLPFLRDFFPALKALFPESEKKQTSTTG